ncbi:hypothetical protein [Candidatus Mesenet endosymbiont of Agriotes lineatus]|uniref:hypothetical protein n=1 Tax=Candidatus Mesenet endosymbiont of Agriotes lineatus TaxID=3077948 RepID=UPI0030D56E93
MLYQTSEFNPVAAAGIFIGVAVATIICFTIIKISEKVSREKDNNPNISTLTALKNMPVSECCKK